jgi:8-oxo-dGTP diphosphatase
MKTQTHIGNVILVVKKQDGSKTPLLLLGKKRPKKKADAKRKRKKVGSGKQVPPGGGREPIDKSQKHGAQRELSQESGLSFPLRAFKKMGTLRGYIVPSKTPIWLVHLYSVDAGHLEQKLVPNEEFSEMGWFPVNKLPFKEMLTGDRTWMPRMLKGEKLSIRIGFDRTTDRMLWCVVKTIKSFN